MDHVHIKSSGKRETCSLVLFGFLVFLSLYLYYTIAHPLYVFDLDDWFNMYNFRQALPSVREMNPIKVLPETWMPMVSYLGAYFIYPLNGDYIASLGIAFAVTVSSMITLYVLSVMAAIRRRFEIKSNLVLVLLGAAFLLSHFAILIVTEDWNKNLFYSQNVTCFFNYVLPALLNLVLWMFFLGQDRKWMPLSPGWMGCLLLAIYLAIFSSLFHSIVLMSLFGIQLLFTLIEGIYGNVRQKKPWISWMFIWDYVKIQHPKLLALVIWFASMAFQMGGRGEDISGTLRLMDVVHAFQGMLRSGINQDFRNVALGINVLAAVVAVYRFIRCRETKFLRWQAEILGSICLIIVYLLLVTGKLSVGYFIRPDTAINWLSLGIFLTVCSMAYLVKMVPKIAWALPLLVYILLVSTAFNDITYAEHNMADLAPSMVKAIDEDIIRQVKAADEQGLTETQVFVPESLVEEGWPLDTNLTNSRISRSLWYHNITDDRVFITVVPSPEKDQQFHLK